MKRSGTTVGHLRFAKLIHWLAAIGLVGALGLPDALAQMPDLDGKGDASRNLGTSATLSLPESPAVLWEFQSDGESINGAKVVGDQVFVMVGSTSIVSLRKRDGRILWKLKVASDQITGMAPVETEDGLMLIATTYEGAMAFDATTGAAIWNRRIEFGLAPPVIVENSMVAAGYSGEVVKVNVSTGELEWTHDFLSDAPPDPDGFDGQRARLGDRPARPQNCSTDGKVVYFNVFDQCRIVGVDVETGERRASMLTQGWVSSRPVITDSRVITGSQDNHVYAMDQDMGHAVWKFKTGARVSASAAVANDRVFIGSCDANFYCLDLKSGDEVWRFEVDHGDGLRAAIYEQAIVCPDSVILPAMNGTLYACDLASGELQWKMRPDEHSEIIDCQTDGEMLFVSTRKNSADEGQPALYAIGSRAIDSR